MYILVMEGKAHLKTFVNSIQLKVSTAVALIMIRTRPLHKSIKSYAKEVQDKYFEYWQNARGKEDNHFDGKIICLQQSKICSILQNIVPPYKYSFDLKTGNEVVPTDEFNCSSFIELSDSDSDSDFELGSAEFIRAMVHLKFAVDSWNTLPLGKVHSVTRNVLQNGPYIKRTEIQQKLITCTQEDSGFESLKMSNDEIENHIVSSSIFRPVTHSSDTDLLLKKSVEAVLKYIHKQITQNPNEAFNKWEGSTLEHMFSILKKALNIGFCSDLIVSLIREILNAIWETSDGNKHVIWEYQCFILAGLCNNEFICEEILNLLSGKLNELTEYLSNFCENSEGMSDIDLLEKSSHFIQLTLVVLLKWKKFIKKASSQKKLDDTCKGVLDLWKMKWQINEMKHSTENRAKGDHEVWKECYEKLLSTCTTNFPLIAYHVWELVKAVDSIDEIVS